MRFIVLHPSYGRPALGVATANRTLARASGRNPVEYHLGLQTNDRRREEYRNQPADPRIRFSVNDGPDQVGNLNSLYWGLGDLPEDTVLIYMSDDIDCPDQWDELLRSAILADARHAGQRFTVMVSDGTRTSEDPLQIVCIASAGYLLSKGYFHHPDYIHLFGDTEFTMAAYRDGCAIEARHIVMRHNHYTYGLAPEDDTYQRGNNERLKARDYAVYRRRERQGFPRRTRRSPLLIPAPALPRQAFLSRGRAERLLWLLAGVTALAFAFKTLAALPLTSLWEDELASALKAFQLSLLQLSGYLRNGVHPPLYYGLLWAAGQLIGQTTLVLRGFSWLAYVAAAGVLAWTCWLWSRSRAAAVIAGALSLALPFTVRYAVEGKGYALLVLLLGLAVQFRIRVLKGDAAAVGGCALFWSAAALTHYYGMGLLLCQAALDGWRRRPPWRPLAWALVLPTLWMLWSWRHLLGSKGREWIPPANLQLLLKLLETGLGPHWPVVVVLFGLLGLVLWLTATPRHRRLSNLVTAWGLDAGVLLLAGSVLVSTVKPSATPRYYIVLVPAVVGIVACWLGVQLSASGAHPWRRWLVGGVMAVVLGLFWRDAYLPIMPAGAWAGTRQRADFRTLVLLAASAEQKFAPSSQCLWLATYDQILRRENVVRPRAGWQCLPERPSSPGSPAAPVRLAAGAPELVVAGTQQTGATTALQEVAPFLEALRAEGYRCAEDGRATRQAQAFLCRLPDPGAPGSPPEPGR